MLRRAREGSPSTPVEGSPGRKNAKNSNIYKLFCEKHAKTTVFTRFSATHMQKQPYLQGFLQRACKNSNIYKVFCKKHANAAVFTRFSATRMQKQQYLRGFLQQAFKNTNIYQVFCNAHAKTAICKNSNLNYEIRNLKFEI